MNLDENDPDTLQLRDELEPEWVNLWSNDNDKKKPSTKQLSLDVIPSKKAIQHNTRSRSMKSR
jgi:hypothetical protein